MLNMSMTMEIIKEQELHNLAMEVVGKRMEEDGFEFMTVNSELQKDPQFVCLKDKKLHFVLCFMQNNVVCFS